VLRVTDGKHAVLFTGDIEAAQETALVAQYGAALASQVLLAPHHGSKTSSTESFLKTVNPQHVVMQNGYRNRFGHPHPSVSQRYLDLGLNQWRSDLDGAVIMDVAMQSITLHAWRGQAQRYWHTRLPAAATLRNDVDGIEF
jgi:competence protein ComEC